MTPPFVLYCGPRPTYPKDLRGLGSLTFTAKRLFLKKNPLSLDQIRPTPISFLTWRDFFWASLYLQGAILPNLGGHVGSKPRAAVSLIPRLTSAYTTHHPLSCPPLFFQKRPWRDYEVVDDAAGQRRRRRRQRPDPRRAPARGTSSRREEGALLVAVAAVVTFLGLPAARAAGRYVCVLCVRWGAFP